MKRFLGVLLGCTLSLCFVTSADALTTHKFDDWVVDGERGTKEKSDDNVTIIKGQQSSVEGQPNPCDGPFSKASVQKLEDGILEETYIELGLDKIKAGEYFEADLGLKNASGEYVTEAVVMTEHGYDGKIKVYAGWAPDFAAYVTEDGIYTYQWHMFIGDDGVAYVNFTLLNGKEVIGTTGDISLDAESITTDDTQNPVAAEEDVSVKYLWFVHVNVADGIKVYSKLPGVENAEIVAPKEDSNLNVADAEKLSDVLKASLKDSEIEGLEEDTAVTFEVGTKEVDQEEVEVSKFATALEEKTKEGKIASYFDISIAVKDAMSNKELGKLTKLSEGIELIVNLPQDLPEVEEGYQRVYYILREHDGEVTVLKTNVSDDGKAVSFTSDEFSTYALAYEDIKNAESTNPNTIDKAPVYLAVGAIALTVLTALGYSVKNKLEN